MINKESSTPSIHSTANDLSTHEIQTAYSAGYVMGNKNGYDAGYKAALTHFQGHYIEEQTRATTELNSWSRV